MNTTLRPVLLASATLLAAFGCISVKTESEIKPIKDMLDRKAAGITSLAMLEARAGATDEDKILIAESNAKKMQRLAKIAKDSGVALETVQKRSAKKFVEKVPAGSGVWYQDEAGSWLQK